jgi:hypothetical protein
MKYCTRCSRWKPLQCFARSQTMSGGRQNYCRVCAQHYQVAYRAGFRAGRRCERALSAVPKPVVQPEARPPPPAPEDELIEQWLHLIHGSFP